MDFAVAPLRQRALSIQCFNVLKTGHSCVGGLGGNNLLRQVDSDGYVFLASFIHQGKEGLGSSPRIY